MKLHFIIFYHVGDTNTNTFEKRPKYSNINIILESSQIQIFSNFSKTYLLNTNIFLFEPNPVGQCL